MGAVSTSQSFDHKKRQTERRVQYRARKQAAVTLVGRLFTRAVLSFFVWRPNQRSKSESESISTLHFQLKHTLNISIYDTPISETNQTSS